MQQSTCWKLSRLRILRMSLPWLTCTLSLQVVGAAWMQGSPLLDIFFDILTIWYVLRYVLQIPKWIFPDFHAFSPWFPFVQLNNSRDWGLVRLALCSGRLEVSRLPLANNMNTEYLWKVNMEIKILRYEMYETEKKMTQYDSNRKSFGWDALMNFLGPLAIQVWS